jgi:hypothetical protein
MGAVSQVEDLSSAINLIIRARIVVKQRVYFLGKVSGKTVL